MLRKIFSATEEPVMSRYDDAEDIEAARMPETTMPQRKDGSIMRESTMKMLSAADCVSSSVGMRKRPMMPMPMAQKMETTIQTMAMIRDCFTSCSLLMPMKRTNTCGMPK